MLRAQHSITALTTNIDENRLKFGHQNRFNFGDAMPLIPIPSDCQNDIIPATRPDEIQVIQVPEQGLDPYACNFNEDVTLGYPTTAKVDPRAGSFGPETQLEPAAQEEQPAETMDENQTEIIDEPVQATDPPIAA